MSDYLVKMDRSIIPEVLEDVIEIRNKMSDFKSVNKILKDESMDIFETSEKLTAKSIDFSMTNMLTPFK